MFNHFNYPKLFLKEAKYAGADGENFLSASYELIKANTDTV